MRRTCLSHLKRAIPVATTGLAIALLVITPQPPAARGDIVETVGVALTGKLLVDNAMSQFEEKTKNLLDRATQAGDQTVAHAAGEMQLLLANVKVMLGDMREKTFADLTVQQQNVFRNLNGTLERAEGLWGQVAKDAELRALDMRQAVDRLRAMTWQDTQDFYISSIRGTTLACQDEEYEVEVTGLGLSLSGNEPKCVVDALLDGKELDPFTSYRQTDNLRLTVKIPCKLLNARFAEDKLNTVPFTIRSVITKSNGLITWNKTYQLTVPLLLLPKTAGEVEVTELVQQKKWSANQTKTITLSRSTKGEKEVYVEEWACGDGKRITGVRYECTDRNGGFAYSVTNEGIAGHDYDPDYTVVDGKRAIVRRKLGTWPLTVSYQIDYQTEETTYEKVSRGKILLKYDEPFEIVFNAANVDGNFVMQGRLWNGKKLYLTSATVNAGDKDNPLQQFGITEKAGDSYKRTFKLVKQP